MAASPRFRSRRSGRSRTTRRSRARYHNGFSTISPRFSVCCSRTPVFARSRTPSAWGRHRCRIPTHRSTQLEAQGKVVFERACAQCHGGPAQSNGHLPIIRFHSIASQCPRPIDTRPIEVVTPARFAFAACPPRLARNARTYEIALSVPTPSPAGVLPAGTMVRRTSSDPGRALLTGFVGGPGPQDDWDKFDMPALRGLRNTAPYFHNNSAATLEEVVDHYTEFFKRSTGGRARQSHPAAPHHRRDERRSTAYERRGTRGAPRVLAKAVAAEVQGGV